MKTETIEYTVCSLLNDIMKFNKESSFELEKILETTKTLISFGIKNNNILNILTIIGNISIGTGGDIKHLALCFGQVKAKNRIMDTELNMFINLGVPMINALAKELEITEDQVRNFIEEKNVSFEDTKNVLEKLSKTRFANLIEKQNALMTTPDTLNFLLGITKLSITKRFLRKK